MGRVKNFFDRIIVIVVASVIFIFFMEKPRTVILSPNFDTNFLHRFYLIADDAMITMRVSYNFARGLGPYFNPGEHISASTSLFWPLILSPIYRVVDLETAILLVSCLTASLIVITFFIVGLSARSVLGAGLALGYLSLSTAIQSYGPSGWETIPQTLLVTAGFCVLRGGAHAGNARRAYPIAAVLIAASFLMRPDSLVMLGILGLFGLYQFSRSFDKSYALGMAIIAVAVVAYFGLQLHFYGDLFPNTYYLKVGASPISAGIKYILRCTYDSGATLVLAAGLLAAAIGWKSAHAGERVAVVCVAAHLCYVVSVGGDAFGAARFLIVILPFGALLAADFIASARHEPSPLRVRRAALVQAALLFAAVIVPIAMTQYFQAITNSTVRIVGKSAYTVKPDAVFDQIGLIQVIRDKVKPEDGEIGLYYLGALAYYLPDYTITDFLGKADPFIAHLPVRWGPVGHNKWDITASLKNHNVAVIPFHLAPDSVVKDIVLKHQDYAFSAETQLNPLIAEKYTFVTPQSLQLNTDWGLYVRNDLLDRFIDTSATPPGSR